MLTRWSASIIKADMALHSKLNRSKSTTMIAYNITKFNNIDFLDEQLIFLLGKIIIQQIDNTFTYNSMETKSATHTYIATLYIIYLTCRCYRGQFARFISFKGSITTNMIKCNQNVMSGM